MSSSHQLSGYYDKDDGTLLSICIRNLDTGEQQEFGKHKPYKDDTSLIVAPQFSVQSSLRLSHLSGNEDSYRVCFNIS